MEKHESYESMTARLDEIISSLEKGSSSLEDTLKLYEEGVRLADECEKYLTQARAKIEILTRSGEGMEPAPFDAGEEE